MSNIYLPVTPGQLACCQKVAREKGVDRKLFQRGLDNGSFAEYLDSLRGLTINPIAIIPPPGAHIRFVHVKVKMDRLWADAVNAAGPDTPGNYDVRKVGDLYKPTGSEEVEEDLIMVNYPQGDGNWDKALAWAQTQGLKNTVPRETFAIGEQHPKLHEQLGVNPMYAVATTVCIFDGGRRACCVWWHGAGRRAYLRWLRSLVGEYCWFVFRK